MLFQIRQKPASMSLVSVTRQCQQHGANSATNGSTRFQRHFALIGKGQIRACSMDKALAIPQQWKAIVGKAHDEAFFALHDVTVKIGKIPSPLKTSLQYSCKQAAGWGKVCGVSRVCVSGSGIGLWIEAGVCHKSA